MPHLRRRMGRTQQLYATHVAHVGRTQQDAHCHTPQSVRHKAKAQRHHQQIRQCRTALQHCRHHLQLPPLARVCPQLRIWLHPTAHQQFAATGPAAHRRQLPAAAQQHYDVPQRQRLILRHD